MKTLILTGGNIERDFALNFMKEYDADCVLAVDRGLKFCMEEEIVPDCNIGDFDSLPGEILTYYKEHTEIPIRAFNPVKDATDTCIALEEAMERGSSEITLLGATGTRLDHVIGSVQILLRAWERGIPAFIVDSHNRLSVPAGNSLEIRREEQFGKYVSFFPMRGTVEGLTLTGFKYPLDNYTLKDWEGLGVSNEIADGCARASWSAGILLMIQSRD